MAAWLAGVNHIRRMDRERRECECASSPVLRKAARSCCDGRGLCRGGGLSLLAFQSRSELENTDRRCLGSGRTAACSKKARSRASRGTAEFLDRTPTPLLRPGVPTLTVANRERGGWLQVAPGGGLAAFQRDDPASTTSPAELPPPEGVAPRSQRSSELRPREQRASRPRVLFRWALGSVPSRTRKRTWGGESSERTGSARSP